MKRGVKNVLLSLLGFSTAPMLTACYGVEYDYYYGPEFHVNGTVTDESYNPIKGIRVTLTNCTDTENRDTFFTDDRGGFNFEVKNLPKIKAEDIDGEENGGLFQSAVREVVSENDRSINIVMKKVE